MRSVKVHASLAALEPCGPQRAGAASPTPPLLALSSVTSSLFGACFFHFTSACLRAKTQKSLSRGFILDMCTVIPDVWRRGKTGTRSTWPRGSEGPWGAPGGLPTLEHLRARTFQLFFPPAVKSPPAGTRCLPEPGQRVGHLPVSTGGAGALRFAWMLPTFSEDLAVTPRLPVLNPHFNQLLGVCPSHCVDFKAESLLSQMN